MGNWTSRQRGGVEVKKELNKAVAMKGLTLSLLHFAFAFCILHFEFKFPAKNSGEKFRFGRKFMVWVKMLGSGENFVFGREF